MDLAARVQKYKEIEAYRHNPLVAYVTSTRANASAIMAADAVREFIDQIEIINEKNSIDILIHSSGGDALTAWKLMSLLREQFKTVNVLVPNMAFSAATIFSLGADEIVMHPYASLGPIDPQITIRVSDGVQRRFSFEDVGAFIRFVAEEVGITEQTYVSTVVDRLFKVVDPIHIGGAKRASELSTDVGERLLLMHMKGAEEKPRARAIADGLNKTFFAHGDAVSRSRARTLNLKIAKDDVQLEKLIWEAYLGIEAYMELRSPFKALEFFVANGGAGALTPVGTLVLPQNAPANVVNAAWNQVAQAAIQGTANPAVQVPYNIVKALIESPRKAAEFRSEGFITASRVVGGEVQLGVTDTKTGWVEKAIPAGAN